MSGDELQTPTGDNVFTTLLIVGGVIFTVVMAIMLSLSDNRQVLGPVPAAPPGVALLASATSLPPTAPLPTVAPTATPTRTPSPSPTLADQATPTVTPTLTPAVVAVLANDSCGNVPGGWLLHTVQPGDTLLSLSASSGATLSEIGQANCLDPTLFSTISQIYLPPAPPVRPVCGPPAWWTLQMVYYGDTLYSLARAHGTTVYAIMQANCLESSYIQAGKMHYLPPLIALPTASPTATGTSTPSPTPSPTIAPTATPLPTASATPTIQPTATSTPAGTFTPSPTPSATATETTTPAVPTTTATPTPTETPLPTATTAATATTTATATPTATATAIATASPAPLPTETPTATATETTLPAPTVTPTFTPTPIPAVGATPSTARAAYRVIVE